MALAEAQHWPQMMSWLAHPLAHAAEGPDIAFLAIDDAAEAAAAAAAMGSLVLCAHLFECKLRCALRVGYL